MSVEAYIRPCMRNIQPYSSARDEGQGFEGILLDANESPYGPFNRYPDPLQRQLKSRIAELKETNPDRLFLGNGSDEIIDLCYRLFCEPQRDKALIFGPTYGMYGVSAAIQQVELVELGLNADFDLDAEIVDRALSSKSLKLMFLCSPNNPTGNTLNPIYIEKLLREFEGILVLDEAYIDFAQSPSWLSRLSDFPNLIVLQTSSKAWAMANLRIGMAFMDPALLSYFNRIKPPYNISGISQAAALGALSRDGERAEQIRTIVSERERLRKALEKLPFVQKVWPSEANFLLVQFEQSDAIFERLKTDGLLVRKRSSLIPNALRITVGSPAENQQLLDILT